MTESRFIPCLHRPVGTRATVPPISRDPVRSTRPSRVIPMGSTRKHWNRGTQETRFEPAQAQRSPSKRVNFVADGVGLTEIIEDARAELQQEDAKQVTLLHANRYGERTPFSNPSSKDSPQTIPVAFRASICIAGKKPRAVVFPLTSCTRRQWFGNCIPKHVMLLCNVSSIAN